MQCTMVAFTAATAQPLVARRPSSSAASSMCAFAPAARGLALQHRAADAPAGSRLAAYSPRAATPAADDDEQAYEADDNFQERVVQVSGGRAGGAGGGRVDGGGFLCACVCAHIPPLHVPASRCGA